MGEMDDKREENHNEVHCMPLQMHRMLHAADIQHPIISHQPLTIPISNHTIWESHCTAYIIPRLKIPESKR